MEPPKASFRLFSDQLRETRHRKLLERKLQEDVFIFVYIDKWTIQCHCTGAVQRSAYN